MKKLFSIFTAFCLAFLLFAGCTPNGESSVPQGTGATTIHIAGLNGPTTMGMVGLMQSVDAGTAQNSYEVSMYGTADEIIPRLIQGEVDIAALPVNLAAALYNQTGGQVQLLAVNTLGVLYIVEAGSSIETIEDLRGCTIYMAGKGSVPEYVLTYVLALNGMEIGVDVFVEFKAEATEVAAILATQEGAVAMLPQPYATAVQVQNESVRIALDMTAEWDAVAGGSTLITGVLVVRREFAEQNPEALAQFLAEYEASVRFVNENTEEAAALVAFYGITPEPIALRAIPLCNITYISGEEMRAQVSGYLQILFEQNPKSVGGALPDEAFFYTA